MNIIIGNIFSVLAVILTIITYQCKKKNLLLYILTGAAVCLCISYLILGAYSGALLNAVVIVRNLIFAAKKVKFFSYKFWPYLLAAVMAVCGALSWQGPLSLLIIGALVINTIFLSFDNVQTLRWSLILTCIMTLIYNLAYQSYGGVANELLAMSSAIVGLIRFRKKNGEEQA